MSAATNVDVLANEWVKKIHFENRVDLNLQLPAPGESGKIEIPELPPFDTTIDLPDKQQASVPATTDSYLTAIVSSPAAKATGCTAKPDCSCYKCQRQKRRARVNKTVPDTAGVTKPATPPTPVSKPPTPVSKPATPISKPPAAATPSPPSFTNTATATTKTTIISSTRAYPPPAAAVTQSMPSTLRNSKRSQGSIHNKRKTPSVKSYDKHLPRPTYSAQDSIYRRAESEGHDGEQTSSLLSSQQPHNSQQDDDNYQISWKDDTTGDDLLNSLKTFQHIFSETEKTAGLSDLLEVRAQEIKRLRQAQAAAPLKQIDEDETEPPAGQVYTLKYRKGSPHRALTLYHTMKIQRGSERTAAYNTAFAHCMRANSGLSGWLNLQSRREPPRALQEYRPRPKKPTKKSILSPIIPGKKRTTTDDMWYKISSSENPAVALPPTNPWNSDDTTTGITPTDVLSAAHALLPSQSPVALHDSLSRANVGAKPYDHVDTPSKPVPTHRTNSDNVSVSSSDNGKKLLFGKKSLRSRSGTINSVKSQDSSIKRKLSTQRSESSRDLDALCRLMPHVERQALRQILAEAGNDYMKALVLCRHGAAEGRL